MNSSNDTQVLRRSELITERLSLKFEEFKCTDIHHKDCVFTDLVRDELVSSFGNVSYNEQGFTVRNVFKRSVRKRKGKGRKSIYCGVRIKDTSKSKQELEDRIEDITKVHEREIKKRKFAEHVANNYYEEWKAERKAKNKALEKQVFITTSHLPDSFYIKNELLNFESNTNSIIGSGVFGTVKLCQYKGSCVAVKCLKTEESEHISKEAALKAILHEAKVVLNLKSHESIPTLLGVSVDEKPFKIVMQFYGIQGQSISLLSLCKCDDKLMLSEEQWHTLLYRLAKAVDHVHNCGYIHNDIKTDNVVLYENNCKFLPVLIDFGKSCKREQGSAKHLKTEEQNIYLQRHKHIAPEIINGSHKQSIYSDIYSFGYLVYNIYKTTCKTSFKLKRIAKECYKVKGWNYRASFAKVFLILES